MRHRLPPQRNGNIDIFTGAVGSLHWPVQTRHKPEFRISPRKIWHYIYEYSVLLKLSVAVKLMVQEHFFKDYSIPLPQNALLFSSHLHESKVKSWD